MSNTDQTIGIPQLILILFLSGLAIRYFFFTASTPAANSSSSGRNSSRAREADVERIQQMFPQVARRSIMWDLQRNGGNVVATTERILSGRGLEVPPQSFQPPPPTPTSSIAPASAAAPAKPLPPDLITRYNLKAKLAEEASRREEGNERNENETEGTSEDNKPGKQRPNQAWSQNKGERQALLQKRREEMILAARRKMEAKVAAEESEGKGKERAEG